MFEYIIRSMKDGTSTTCQSEDELRIGSVIEMNGQEWEVVEDIS